MSNHSVGVLCTNCGLVSHRPVSFVRVRRTFVCGGCKELIPLNERTVLEDEELATIPTSELLADET